MLLTTQDKEDILYFLLRVEADFFFTMDAEGQHLTSNDEDQEMIEAAQAQDYGAMCLLICNTFSWEYSTEGFTYWDKVTDILIDLDNKNIGKI